MARFLRGLDIDGDAWTLRLHGPGDFQVINQPGDDGDPIPVGQPALIDQIILGGPDPGTTRLIGKVNPGPNGDGKIFFARFTELGGAVTQAPISGDSAFGGFAAQDPANLGPHAIDMPGFWLGQTSDSATAPDPTIDIPDGVNTLRFGGVDVTFTPPGGTPLDENSQSDTFTVSIGLPKTWGVSVIVDSIVTNAHQNPTTPTQVFQDGVVFDIQGRVNVFQANTIVGNPDFPSSGFLGGGGTVVRSRQDSLIGVTGQFGFVRIGGDATNFSVQTNDRMQNVYIGGETDNVLFLAPDIIRNMFFGRGMDTVTVFTGHVDSIQSNRGALDTEVTTRRGIRRITFGGDVVNSTILSGYRMDLENSFVNQSAPDDITAHEGGRMDYVLVAGDIMDSVFAAGVEPFEGDFSSPFAVKMRGAYIHAKVEGTIDNSAIQPEFPTTAFFAQTTNVIRGPVNPPKVNEPPFPHMGAPPSGPRVVEHLQPTKPRAPHNRTVRILPALRNG
jgi:hypothetical protein